MFGQSSPTSFPQRQFAYFFDISQKVTKPVSVVQLKALYATVTKITPLGAGKGVEGQQFEVHR